MPRQAAAAWRSARTGREVLGVPWLGRRFTPLPHRTGDAPGPTSLPSRRSLILESPWLGTSADLHPAVVLDVPTQLLQALRHPGGPFLLRRQRAECARRGERGSLVPAVAVDATEEPHVGVPRL